MNKAETTYYKHITIDGDVDQITILVNNEYTKEQLIKVELYDKWLDCSSAKQYYQEIITAISELEIQLQEEKL